MARGSSKVNFLLTLGGVALAGGVAYYAWSSGFLAELMAGGAPAVEEPAEEPTTTTTAPEEVPGVTDYPTLTETLNAPATGGRRVTSPYVPYPVDDDGYVPTTPTPTVPQPDSRGCYPGTRYSNCFRACVPAGLQEPASNSIYCVGYVPPNIPPVITPGECPAGQVMALVDNKQKCIPVNATCAERFGGGCSVECGNGTKLNDPRCVACRACFPSRPNVMCNEGAGYKWDGTKCTKTPVTTPVPVPPIPVPVPVPVPANCQQNCRNKCAHLMGKGGYPECRDSCYARECKVTGIPGFKCPSGTTGTWPICKAKVEVTRPKPTTGSTRSRCLDRCKDACKKVKSRDRGRCNQTCERSCRSSRPGVGLNIGAILRNAGIKSNLALAYAGSRYSDDGVYDSAYYVTPTVV